MTPMLDSGGTGGSLSSPDDDGTEPEPEPEPAGTNDPYTTTFDTSTQTLGTTSLGTTTGTNDQEETEDVTVTRSSDDPSDSSPAGGAGAEEAVERFAGLPDETLDDASREEILAVGNAASAAQTAAARARRGDVGALRNSVLVGVRERVGSLSALLAAIIATTVVGLVLAAIAGGRKVVS